MNDTVTITLHRDQAAEFADRLSLLEDWLMHTDDLVIDDLARFGAWHCYDPSQAIADLIGDLGEYGVVLRRGLDQTTTSTRRDTPMNQQHTKVDTVNGAPPPAGPAGPQVDNSGDEEFECLCHPTLDCPDQATVTINARELERCHGVLVEVAEFLRCGNGIVELPADYYGARGHHHPQYDASPLNDRVGLTAEYLRRHTQANNTSE